MEYLASGFGSSGISAIESEYSFCECILDGCNFSENSRGSEGLCGRLRLVENKYNGTKSIAAIATLVSIVSK